VRPLIWADHYVFANGFEGGNTDMWSNASR
jgi:hypothetical protein